MRVVRVTSSVRVGIRVVIIAIRNVLLAMIRRAVVMFLTVMCVVVILNVSRARIIDICMLIIRSVFFFYGCYS